MSDIIYVGVVNGLDTWEVYQDGKLIGFNQKEPEEQN
jgi:hypothetical protein